MSLLIKKTRKLNVPPDLKINFFNKLVTREVWGFMKTRLKNVARFIRYPKFILRLDNSIPHTYDLCGDRRSTALNLVMSRIMNDMLRS